MKLIIWWLSLMIILPLLYLFWWKKRWRLLFGIIILTVLAISCFLPGEFAYSILTTETEKEKEKPLQQLNNSLKNISSHEPNPSDSEKTQLEKSISKSREKVKKGEEKIMRGEKLSEEEVLEIRLEIILYLPTRQSEWIKKWGKKENSPTFLFCGEEFNKELIREKKSGEVSLRTVESYNIIDFGQQKNNKPDFLKKKLQEIYEQKENSNLLKSGYSPIIWLKNIDKITNSEIKNKLLKIVDSKQNTDLGKYQVEVKSGKQTKNIEKTVDLSQFTLVATTSTTNPKLSPGLRAKLKHVEPFLDKHFWIIFFTSGGLEIVAFLLLIREKKKDKSKSLKQFEY